MQKLNYKLILLHTLAGIFLIWALNELVYLYDSELLRIYDNVDIIDAWKLDNKAERISKLFLLKYSSSYISLLISFIISLILTVKRKRSALNSILSFIMIAILIRVGFITSDPVEKIVYFPGEAVNGFSIKSVVINGVLLTTVSMLLYFSKFINKLILKDESDETVENNAESDIKR